CPWRSRQRTPSPNTARVLAPHLAHECNRRENLMRFTDIFLHRPVLSLVVSLLIFLVGLRALLSLPIRQYPRIARATITVRTVYPGASPDLVQGFIPTPIAQAIATADGVEYLTSTSTQGQSTVSARLRLNANSDRAMTEIMAKVNEVKFRIPRDAYDS